MKDEETKKEEKEDEDEEIEGGKGRLSGPVGVEELL